MHKACQFYDEMFDSIFIYGPTASGKTDLSLRLAQRLQGEIINVDALQQYVDLPILSAQPTPDVRAQIPHHLFGTLDALAQSNAADWYGRAIEAFNGVRARQRLPLFVGGTGLHFKTLLEGISPMPPVSDVAHHKTREMMAALSRQEVLDFLIDKDPSLHGKSGWEDPQRLYRALSIYHETGQPIGVFQEQEGRLQHQFTPLIISFALPRNILLQRIEQRCAHMLSGGAVAEVRHLMEKGASQQGGVFKTIGYKEIQQYLEGEITHAEMVNRIVIKTRQYAKRQATWERHQLQPHVRIRRYDGKSLREIVELCVGRFLNC